MTDHERGRLVAWAAELRRAHARLRAALALTRQTLRDAADPRPAALAAAARELVVYCHGFCAALDGHHRAEDRALFPAIEAAHPELAPVLRALEQDHSMLAHLLQGLRAAAERFAPAAEIETHVEGIAALMESHFRYEERQLLAVLDELRLDGEVTDLLGPL